MKAADIEALKQMASEVMSLIPGQVFINGKGEFFIGWEQIKPMDLLARIEQAKDAAVRLNEIVQSIQPRKGK